MKVLVTGGAGFIGCNAVKRYLERGDEVVIIDNLSRRGADKNWAWLQTLPKRPVLQRVDVRDFEALSRAFEENRDAGVVLHLAAQVAVTTSVTDPRHDFEVNALGTFNVLEATRRHTPNAVMLHASTNKVYGGLESLGVEERGGRYQLRDSKGVTEEQPLDFHSPYGCSKGAGDQYVRDYARIYGLKTVCFRQSCIYGYRQFGVEDQGWIAWFTIATVLGKPVTIYGDGKQVRDVLFVDDLVDAYLAAERNIEKAKGQVYNMGGGHSNQLSLLELVHHLEELARRPIKPASDKWRPGNQPVFVCDIRKAERDLGWKPATSAPVGIERLYRWVVDNRSLFE